MKKILFASTALVLLVGALAAAAGVWWLRDRQPEWTTRSPAALDAFEAGLESYEKYYWMDALRHFDRALELDPGFVAAQLYRVRLMPSEWQDSETIREHLTVMDLAGLTDRERLLVEVYRDRVGGHSEEAIRRADAYLEEHPGDPWALAIRCDGAWALEDWDRAEACYTRLLELHPNRVFAQNRLGYIAMGRGRFDQAEERFKTYRYIAPDQANPHDSLGQLLALRGRYEEAGESFEEAVRVKPEFCASYLNLGHLYAETGEFERAREALERLDEQEDCQWAHAVGQVCANRAWISYLEGELDEAWSIYEDGCLRRRNGIDPLAHRLSLAVGKPSEAFEIERRIEERIVEVEEKKPQSAVWFRSALEHFRGVRSLAAGDFEAASRHLRSADDAVQYWGPERAGLKIWNLMNLRRALTGLGDAAGAEEVRSRIAAVNPVVVDMELPDLAMDGAWLGAPVSAEDETPGES